MSKMLHYLNAYVTPDEPWEILIKNLKAKGIRKADIEKRVAFLVVSGKKGKINTNKADAWLAICETFPQFQVNDEYVQEFKAISAVDDRAVSLRKELKKIPYYSPSAIILDSRSHWSISYLTSVWKLEESDAAEEIALYGIYVIELWMSSRPEFYQTHLRGRYHVVHSLQQFIEQQKLDVVVIKQHEIEPVLKQQEHYSETVCIHEGELRDHNNR